jgi:CBS domain-containing protein
MHESYDVMTFDKAVSSFMTDQVASIRPDAMLSFVARELEERRISAMPVVDAKGEISGVVSRTDLLRVGRVQAGSQLKAAVLTLPEQRAGDLTAKSTRAPITVSPTTSLRDAAQVMCDEHVHRLFVVDGRVLVGVISTLDVMAAVRNARVSIAIDKIMSVPLITVNAHQPISIAIERLAKAHVSGLVVVDDEFPVGVFTQVEALQARDLPRDTPIDEVLDPSLLCLPNTTTLFRAAEQARRLEVRRIIPLREREAVGIVTAFDFAKFVASELR